MKKLIRSVVNRLGYSIAQLPLAPSDRSPYTPLAGDRQVVDLDRLAAFGNEIPGMVTSESGKFLYSMCALQETSGAVVEIGSWQGRSTSFLARAVKESGNGPLYAIDHFRGNVGKEQHYVVGNKDLSDLRKNFESNLRRLELWNVVTLLDMPNHEAADQVRESIRFLFIDGDHTSQGVSKDIELFVPKLAPNAIVVFDDYESNFDGLVNVVNQFVSSRKPSAVFSYRKTLVVRL